MAESFAPLIDRRTEILIIGTMPGVKSLEEAQYYAHPRNAMWPIIARIYNQDKAFASYREKTACLLKNRIGMWDNLQFCERRGSLDSNIKNEIPNDFEQLLEQYPRVGKLLFNGQKSYGFFKKYHPDLLKRRQYRIMPSTSPANASQKAAFKFETWRKELTERNIHESGIIQR